MNADPSVERRFPVGCCVVVKDGEQFPHYRGDKGTVIGYRNGFYPKVKFERIKTIDGWHPDLLRRYSIMVTNGGRASSSALPDDRR